MNSEWGKIGWTIHLYHPENENYERATVTGHWKTPVDDFKIGEPLGDLETYKVYDQESLEWIPVNVNVGGPIVKFSDGTETMILLEKCGTSYYEHYQTIRETEKSICVSLDGTDWCNAWIPKSVIIGKTRQRGNRRDPEAMKTPIKKSWAIMNETTMGPIRV